MSERMTSINLPGLFGGGIAEWGLKTPAEMLAMIRNYATDQKRMAEEILSAGDGDFRIETYKGPHARIDLRIIQNGRQP